MKVGAILSAIIESGSALAAAVVLFMGIVTPTPMIMAGLGMAALAAAAFSTWKRGLDFLSVSQYMHGLSFIAIALAGAGNSTADVDLARAVFFASLGIGIAVSLLPVSRSLVDIIIRLRRFPGWFKATALFHVMDMSFGIAWAVLLTLGAVLFYLHMYTQVRTVLMIAGLGSELVVIALLQAHGYRYVDFMTGRAKPMRRAQKEAS